MLFDFQDYITKPITGIIQVGAHYGSEYLMLSKYTNNILMFEPQPEVFQELSARLNGNPNLILENKACGSFNGTVEMNVETKNNGQSSSILEPLKHLDEYPFIKFDNKIEVPIVTLKKYFSNKEFNYNMLCLDTQGFELEIMKGADNLLEKVDYIYCEINFIEMYKNCPTVEEIDTYLSKFGFNRVYTYSVKSEGIPIWGDAFYARK